MPKQFWKVKNIADNVGELLIYGDLSDSTWWGDEVTPKQFNEDLDSLNGVNELHIRINSYGGDVFAGHAMLNSINNFKRKNDCEVKVFVDGIAASAASVVAMAGDKIIMPANTMMMVHDPAIGICGYVNETKLRQYLDAIGPIKDSIVAAYYDRTGIEKDSIAETMKNETWMTAATAIELGYADVLSDEIELDLQMKSDDLMIINNIEVDCKQFKNMPMQFMNIAKKPPKTNAPVNKPEQKPKNEPEEEIMNKEDLKNKFPDVYNEIFAEGETAERTRIQNIEKLGSPGHEKLVNTAKFEKPINSGQLAEQIIIANNAASKQALEAVKNDASKLDGVDAAKDEIATEAEETEADIKNMVDIMNAE